jgi:hypothetical protein
VPISDGSSAFIGVIATPHTLATEAAMGAFRTDGLTGARQYVSHRVIRWVTK